MQIFFIGVLRQVHSGSLSVLIWCFAGVITCLGALIYAELGITYPHSGEKYTYLMRMFGRKTAFLYLWTYLFVFRTGGNAIKSLAFSKYILEPIFSCQNIPPFTDIILALVFSCQ